jgi:hypothetical protein
MKMLKAFTLLELLFVMILTTIIIGIGYFAFSVSIKQIYFYKKNSKKITEAFQLTMLLNKDLAEAQSAVKSNNVLVLTSKTNSELRYYFGEEYIVRKNSFAADTFFYETQSRSEKFLDKPADPNNGLVDEIYFEMKTNEEQFEIFHAVKPYSSEALIKHENLKQIIF